MADKENLDSMAQKYKEEMLRLYRRSGGNESISDRTPYSANSSVIPQKTIAAEDPPPQSPPPANTSSVLRCTNDGCRFLSPDEIMRKESGEGLKPDKKPYCDIAVTESGTDITASLLNGAGFSGENLVTSGTAGLDIPGTGNKPSDKMSDKFAGIYLAPVCDAADSTDDDPENTSRKISSGIYSDEIPDYLRLPADSSEETIVPQMPDSSFIVPDRWNSLTGDTGWGYLQFDVCGGEKNAPLKGAAIIITRNAGDRVLLSRIMTAGSSGRTPTAVLPAPERNSAVRCVPYAEYNALVYADGYKIARNVKVKISAGIKTIQPVYLPQRTEV